MKLVHDANAVAAKKPKDPVEAALSVSYDHLFVDLSECLRLIGGSAANGDNNDPLILQGEAKLKFRKLATMFGFDRLPFTYGEVHGLLDYCQRLYFGVGREIQNNEQREAWQLASARVFERKFPQYLPAFKLFYKGDLASLRALHTAEDTLTKLGKAHREFP